MNINNLKLIFSNKNFNNNQGSIIIAMIIAFLFVFLCSSTTSPWYNRYPFWFYGDAGVFQEMGLCILKGGTPYVDLFDHKGPVLFFFQAIGLWLSRNWGIMTLQIINLFFTLIIWYKTISNIEKRQWQIWGILFVCLFILWMFYQRGNLCEEWSLPFISLPIYLYIKRYTQHKSYCHKDIFVVGLCFSVLAYIRLNNAAPMLGFLLFHLISKALNRNYKDIIIDIVLLITSFVLVSIPLILFFYFKAGWNGVYEMYYGTFIFNIIYFSNGSGLSILGNICYFITTVGGLIISSLCIRKPNLHITIPLITSYIIGILTLGNAHFYHYLMTFIPLLVVTFSLFTSLSLKIGYLLTGIILIQCFAAGYSAIDCFVFRLRGGQPDTMVNDEFHSFAKALDDEDRESVWNYNLGTGFPEMFAEEGLVQCNRFLTDKHIAISPRFQEYAKTHTIETIQPKWILVQNVNDINSDELSYIKNNYTIQQIIHTNGELISCCIRKNTNI